jgi:pantothenate synthetase
MARAEMSRSPLIKIQYLEMRSIDRLKELAEVDPGNTLVAVAAHLGKTRLLDNIRI